MICFKDRSFCDSDCVNRDCYRNFSPALQAEAREWWKGFKAPGPAPVFGYDMSQGCPDYRPPTAPDRPEDAVMEKG
jgi:hypothetical protein